VRAANAQLQDAQKIRRAVAWPGRELPRTEGTRKLKRAAIRDCVQSGEKPVAAATGDSLEALVARFARGRPILGICLGLQVALDETEEDGGVAGLGLVAGRSARLRDGRVPRIGWARVGDGDAFYFAHSYAASTPYAVAWSEDIVAEVRCGAFVGCQFHPEKSGASGAAYLESVCRSLG